jgi:hypothetical protein
MASAEQDPDPWMQRVSGYVLGGIFLMGSLVLFFFGTYGALHDVPGRSPDYMNKAILCAPTQFCFAIRIMVPSPTDSEPEDNSEGWQWLARHWRLCLVCIAVECLVLTCWVSYLHHHGVVHVS